MRKQNERSIFDRTNYFSNNWQKIPHPDGCNATFYQTNRELVVKDVIEAREAFQSVFKTRNLLKEWNVRFRQITLVPQTGNLLSLEKH